MGSIQGVLAVGGRVFLGSNGPSGLTEFNPDTGDLTSRTDLGDSVYIPYMAPSQDGQILYVAYASYSSFANQYLWYMKKITLATNAAEYISGDPLGNWNLGFVYGMGVAGDRAFLSTDAGVEVMDLTTFTRTVFLPELVYQGFFVGPLSQ